MHRLKNKRRWVISAPAPFIFCLPPGALLSNGLPIHPPYTN
jgi:hypothetical protein